MPRPSPGFTLLEVMMVVVIIGILTAIALPSYNAYVLRGNRMLAKSILHEIVARQNAWFNDRKRYSDNLADLGYPADVFYLGKDGNPRVASDGAIYAVTLADTDALAFTVTATALGQQVKDDACKTLSLNASGGKSSTGGGGTDCWTR